MEDEKAYRFKVSMKVIGNLYIHADSLDDAIKAAPEIASMDSVILDDYEITDVEYDRQMDLGQMFAETLKSAVRSMAESHGIDPALLETPLANFSSTACKIVRTFAPSGMMPHEN